VLQDVDKEMEVMDEVLPESVTEQQAQFERADGPAGDNPATAAEQKPQRQS
jgi:hypothetical protein